jgi:hypothetical protein
MCLLTSVHTLSDVPLRLYANESEALSDRASWKRADASCQFIGFRLVTFRDGVPVAESKLMDAVEV